MRIPAREARATISTYRRPTSHVAEPKTGRWQYWFGTNPAEHPADLEHARWVSNLLSSINWILSLIPSQLCLNFSKITS